MHRPALSSDGKSKRPLMFSSGWHGICCHPAKTGAGLQLWPALPALGCRSEGR